MFSFLTYFRRSLPQPVLLREDLESLPFREPELDPQTPEPEVPSEPCSVPEPEEEPRPCKEAKPRAPRMKRTLPARTLPIRKAKAKFYQSLNNRKSKGLVPSATVKPL